LSGVNFPPFFRKNRIFKIFTNFGFFLIKNPKIKVLTPRLKTHIIPYIPKGGGDGLQKAKS